MDSRIDLPLRPPAEVLYPKVNPRLAHEAGRFYNSFIKIYLDPGISDSKTDAVSKLVETLPGPMRTLFKKGATQFQDELNANHQLLQSHSESEVEFLLRSHLPKNKSAHEQEQIMSRVTPESFKLVEPTPGIAVIEAKKDLFRFLIDQGYIGGGELGISDRAGAVFFAGDTRNEPSFMLVPNLDTEDETQREVSRFENPRVRHEFQHFIWHFLQRTDFARKPENPLSDLGKAFSHFRSEIGSYLVERRPDFGTIEPKMLVYTKDEVILKRATQARNLISFCLQFSKVQGVDSLDFLYATMSARNFDELESQVTDLIHIPKPATLDSIGDIFVLWSNNQNSSEAISRILGLKNVSLTDEVVEQLALRQLSGDQITDFGTFHRWQEMLERFSRELGAGPIKTERIIDLVRVRLNLPYETVKMLMELPIGGRASITLNPDRREFIGHLISIWRISEDTFPKYKAILDSNPDLRLEYDKLKDEIIQKGAQMYRLEMSAREPEWIETEVTKRTTLLKAL